MKPLIINKKETKYLIDEFGHIYNKTTKKELIGSIKNGYKSVKLTIDGNKKDYLVHRLVAITFIENKNNLSQVNHKDGNKMNNAVSNLEWISPSDNVLHSWNELKRKDRRKQLSIDEDILNNENWKQFLSTNYYVSKNGKCANLKTKKYLNASITQDGYLKYSLYIDGKSKNYLAHLLTYQVFYPEDIIENNEQINHKDGNKQNNSLDNLEKISNTDNMIHSYYTLHQNIIKVKQYDFNNNLINTFSSLSEAERLTGFLVSGISQAINGKIKTYKGFIWKKE